MDDRVKTLHPHIHSGLYAAASTRPCDRHIDMIGVLAADLSVRGDDGAIHCTDAEAVKTSISADPR
jgi:AICAR transformylase/IMP cyclohydrolase PurH